MDFVTSNLCAADLHVVKIECKFVKAPKKREKVFTQSTPIHVAVESLLCTWVSHLMTVTCSSSYKNFVNSSITCIYNTIHT